MKILIWFGTFFVGTLLNTILGIATGVRAGTALLYIVEFFIARKLCKLWDEKHNPQKTDNQQCELCGCTSFDSEGKCNNCGSSQKIDCDKTDSPLLILTRRNYKCGKCGNIGPYDGNCPNCNSSVKIYFDEEIIQDIKTINVIPDDKKLEKCEMCNKSTGELISTQITDSTGTQYKKLCLACIAKYNSVSTEENQKPNEPVSKVIFCRKCGAKLIEGSLFCSKCGNKVI